MKCWCVDGRFSGSKNMPLFPDLFLRDSHFGNSVRASMLQRVSGQLFVSERLNLEIQFVTRRFFSAPGAWRV